MLRLALEERAIGNCFAILEGPSDYEIDRLLVDTRTPASRLSSQVTLSGLYTVPMNRPSPWQDGLPMCLGCNGQIGQKSPTKAHS